MAGKKNSDWPTRQEEKWSRSAFRGGYTVLPHNLFRCAAKLGIRPTQQTVLFHLLDFWFEGEGTQIPVSKGELAERIGMDKRQVQRHLRKLENLGLISSSYPNRPGLHAKVYQFDGLVKKLGELSTVYRREKRQKNYERDEALRSVAKSN